MGGRKKKKKQNKTRIITNQDRKHGFQIKTDTMDALTKGKLIKWTWGGGGGGYDKNRENTNKVNSAFELVFIARGAVFTLFLPGLGVCQEAKSLTIRIKVASALCEWGKYDS